MNEAEFVFLALKIWAVIGALVAVPFLLVGIDRIDEDARGSYIFRPLLVPGVILIWPLVLWRWLVLETDGGNWSKRYLPPRKGQGKLAIGMAVAIVIAVVSGIYVRQTWPSDYQPQQLSMVGDVVL